MMNQLNLTTLAAVLGLLLSAWNFFSNRKQQKKDISVSMPAYMEDHERFIFRMVLINKSSLPITITRLQMNLGGKLYDLGRHSMVFYEHRYSSHAGKTAETTDILPIHLESLAYSSPVFLLYKVPFEQTSPVSVTISTNRGKLERQVSIPKSSCKGYLNFLEYIEK